MRNVRFFLIAGLLCLVSGALFGLVSGFQFLIPHFFDELDFHKTRPLHVSLVVAFIFISSSGSVYFFVKEKFPEVNVPRRLMQGQLVTFLFGGIAILIALALGNFGGREYWEANPILYSVVIVSWLFFIFGFFKSVKKIRTRWPVYLWMWSTGVVFFLFTFLESLLYLIPSIDKTIIKDLTLQWKSYGALVGSWNMLVYGIAIYLSEKLSNNENVGTSRLAYSLYFLGFFNLLFGWAHHIYPVPSHIFIRIISYFVSMTELFILFKIILDVRTSFRNNISNLNSSVWALLASSDLWILLNLFLAIIISIPYINIYSHGTHTTVAHAMGSTIGINTFILFASICYISIRLTNPDDRNYWLNLRIGIVTLNVFLAIFWLFLIFSGFYKGVLMVNEGADFYAASVKIKSLLVGFVLSGIGVFAGIFIICFHLIRKLWVI